VASVGRSTVDVLTRVYQFVVDREPVASCVAIKKGVLGHRSESSLELCNLHKENAVIKLNVTNACLFGSWNGSP